MTIESICGGRRRARKAHQCFHCYRTIAPGTLYRYHTCKYDYVYTIKMHIDCDDAATKAMRLLGMNDFYDYEGIPPLWDLLIGDGYFDSMCPLLRGFFPHVVTRMELNRQMQQIRAGDWIPPS